MPCLIPTLLHTDLPAQNRLTHFKDMKHSHSRSRSSGYSPIYLIRHILRLGNVRRRDIHGGGGGDGMRCVCWWRMGMCSAARRRRPKVCVYVNLGTRSKLGDDEDESDGDMCVLEDRAALIDWLANLDREPNWLVAYRCGGVGGVVAHTRRQFAVAGLQRRRQPTTA